jgi:succinate dehydrogenase / fumarate reductase cytochrome b subunit
MAFGKNIGLRGMTYRGGGPMLAWLLHRISGLGIVLFVATHVLASFLMHVLEGGETIGTAINVVYESWPFQILIYFCAVFHALNGLRIIVLDTWPKFLKYQREMTWLQWAFFIPIYGLAVFLIIQRAFAVG